MQLPTHLIAGIIVQFTIYAIIPPSNWFSAILVVVIAFSSHFLLDALARFTYHPPERIHDNFWLTWHIFVYLIGFVIIGLCIWEYWLGMLFANLPDLWDWYTLRNIASRKSQPDWGKSYYLHPIADKIRQLVFLRMPDLTYKRVGILPELSLIVLWIGITIVSIINSLF
ncbi:MAG: hypothetical protein JSW11_04605 [Candidatus Heimdallarchaeota archaeon]|nr:MAG: hypothetical protein JSW11_04605 [Candidatus Heimdallarchaeota archaeon]